MRLRSLLAVENGGRLEFCSACFLAFSLSIFDRKEDEGLGTTSVVRGLERVDLDTDG